MLTTATTLATSAVVIAMALNVWRIFRWPAMPDRILALDTLAINTIALVLLLGIANTTADYFEAALLIAMMGFVGTAALCKFLLRGDVIE